jgi:phosphomannomutase
MNNPKKVIVCDLDGTLAVSKSPLTPDMAEVIGHLLERYMFVVVSGGAFSQFKKQFISQLTCEKRLLKNLYLFPTMGTTCYVYDEPSDSWKQVYDEPLAEKERKSIIKALQDVVKKFELDKNTIYGDLIEDRGSQVTLSGLGQNAPIDEKEKWDPDQTKRRKMVTELQKVIPKFEIRIGGTTSIDITKKGLDKAYAMGKIKELLKIEDEDVIFVGDALYKGGNDEAVKKTGVDFIQPDDVDQTLELLSRYM